MRIRHLQQSTIILNMALIALTSSITGCSVSNGTPTAVAGQAVRGHIIGGQQPVANSTVQLYAVGTNGYGSAAAPLLNQAVTSDANGNFSLTGAYTCPSATTPVYMVVNGGNPGLAAGTNNNALAMMGLLGYCGDLGPTTYLVINERTTVAAVWALAPFMTDYNHIGTSRGNVQGMNDAFSTAASLVNISNGASPGTAPAIATIPTVEINTLADIIAACINTDGSLSSTAACGRLFTAATPTGSAAPTDTIAAALDIARNPSHNVASIFNVLQAAGPFQPSLAVTPTDWTIGINYASPAFKTPADLAIDSQDNAWVLSSSSGNSSTVSLLNITQGIVASFPQTGASYGHLALDTTDGPWLTDTAGSGVMQLTSSGTPASSNPYTGGGIQGPGPLAFDGNGNLWVGNSGPTVSKLSANGSPWSPSTGYGTGGASGPIALALDGSGNAWVADSSSDSVSILTGNGQVLPGSPYTGGGLSSPFAIAIDAIGNAWVANRQGNSLSRFTSGGTVVAGSPYSGAGLNQPIDMALDGLGNVWLVNSGSNSVSEFQSTGRAQSGNAGYGNAVLANPFRLAIDNAGSVWVANLGSSSPTNSVITQLVGVAAPVVTPQAIAVQDNLLAQRP
jgi:hypothetical protein